MSEYIRLIILGIVQGLTEFLPVSSSGHLEIVKYILADDSLGQESMITTVVLHLATALSTLFVFRKDIYEILSKLFVKDGVSERNFAMYVIVSLIPAGIIGVLFQDQIEQLFDKQLILVGGGLLLTGLLLLFADRASHKGTELSMAKSLVIGIAQAIAILPGISRSGATIGSSILLGVKRSEAARFSFLMVIPLIFGKILLDLKSGELFADEINWMSLGMGFVAAFIAGILACKLMIKIVNNSKLTYFALYCFAVGIMAIIIGR